MAVVECATLHCPSTCIFFRFWSIPITSKSWERWRQMTAKKLPVTHQLFPAWAYFLAERILSPVLKKKWKTKYCKMRFAFTRPVTNVFVLFPTDLESEIFPVSSLSEFHSFSFGWYLADPWIIQQREKFTHWKVKCSRYLALCGPTLAPSNDELAAMSSSRMAPDSMPKAPTHWPNWVVRARCEKETTGTRRQPKDKRSELINLWRCRD